jgi:hypothetical protein
VLPPSSELRWPRLGSRSSCYTLWRNFVCSDLQTHDNSCRIIHVHQINVRTSFGLRGCIQKFQDLVDNEINNNNEHSLRSNTKGYGGKTHYTDSQNNGTHLVEERCTICSSLFLRPVRKFLDAPSYFKEMKDCVYKLLHFFVVLVFKDSREYRNHSP